MENEKLIWVFNGLNGKFPGGVFSSRELAEKWISAKRLSGTLTAYPLDWGVYDWAITNNFFLPKTEEHHKPEFIAKFTSASQQHFHYEEGVND